VFELPWAEVDLVCSTSESTTPQSCIGAITGYARWIALIAGRGALLARSLIPISGALYNKDAIAATIRNEI